MNLFERRKSRNLCRPIARLGWPREVGLHWVWLSMQLWVRAQVGWHLASILKSAKLEYTNPPLPQSHNSSLKFLYKFPPCKLCSSTLRRPNFFFFFFSEKKLGEYAAAVRNCTIIQNVFLQFFKIFFLQFCTIPQQNVYIFAKKIKKIFDKKCKIFHENVYNFAHSFLKKILHKLSTFL